ATATVRIAFDDLKCVGSQDFPCFAAQWRHRSAFAPRVRELSELDLVIAGPDPVGELGIAAKSPALTF
ncbi:hypothetical protein, partial [Rhodoblastus sp.]|uniref:hypothetical protein n=1 Tax=Rhodoblastus sp. TaxID=1962975 RepID=UPI003F9CB1D3